MKAKIKRMEEEAAKLAALQGDTTTPDGTDSAGVSEADAADIDSRSVYVGNVDYSTTPDELQQFFAACGTVNRITILCDKFTGHPKGFAYVEFKEADSVSNAMLLNAQEFKGRALKIKPKRTNVPGFKRVSHCCIVTIVVVVCMTCSNSVLFSILCLP
jgi:polyadenylate-binding protein 2